MYGKGLTDWGDVTVLYLDFDDGSVTVYICQIL